MAGIPTPPRTWGRYRVIFYLLLGLAAVDVAVVRYRDRWDAYDPNEYVVRPAACRARAWDAIVVGGSPVCEGIDPAVMAGVSFRGQHLEHVYNLGLSGATTTEIWHAVEHGISAPPRLLVYGMTASDLNDGRDEPQGARVLMDARDVARQVATRPGTAEWVLRQYTEGRCARLWSLFRYRNGIRLWAADLAERWLPGACPEAADEARKGLLHHERLCRLDGFAPRTDFQQFRLDERRAAGEHWSHFPFFEKYHVGGHLRYLHRLLDWAERDGVAVVLVDMPVSGELEETRYPQAFAAYRQALAQIEESRHVTVLRATRQTLGMGDADFADLIHVNAHGTAKLSGWLRERLADDAPKVASR
jgi:hypothetical protein